MTPRLIPSAGVDPRQRLKAIGLMALATVCFAALDRRNIWVGTKGVPVAQVTWLRFVGHVVFSALALWPFAVKPSLRSAKPLMQLFRSALMICTTGFNFVALKYLQLDQTVTIFFLTPLLVAALAGPLLHEWVGWHRMVAILAGFLGVLIVMQPGFGTLHSAMLFALIATLGYALYNLSTRYLASHDPPEVTQTYTPLAGALVMLPFALGAWQAPQDATIWLLFATLGLWGGLGHWLLILSHRSAPAPVLAPFIYLGLIWMSALGFLIFGNLPTLWTLSGGAIVILSGLYLFARAQGAGAEGHWPRLRHCLAMTPRVTTGLSPLATSDDHENSSWPGSSTFLIWLSSKGVDARHRARHGQEPCFLKEDHSLFGVSSLSLE
jgi:drug/metabolite transporter (DMT)-like permease